MKLRSRAYGSTDAIVTNFKTGAAVLQYMAEAEARALADDDEDDGLSDTEALTALFRRLGAMTNKRRRSSTTSSTLSSSPHPFNATDPTTTNISLPPTRSSASSTTVRPVPNDFATALSRPPEVTSAIDVPPPKKSKNKHNNVRRQWNRLKKAKGERPANERGPSLSKATKLVDTSEKLKKTQLVSKELPATRCAYNAKATPRSSRWLKEDTLEELVEKGYEVVEWDGKARKAVGDADENLIVMLAGKPNDPSFDAACTDLYNIMMKKGGDLHFLPKHLDHVRGRFPAINVGVTHGKGSKTPHTLEHGAKVKDIVYGILEDKSMKRVALFQDSAFKTWFPKIYEHYGEYVTKLWAKGGWNEGIELRRNFEKGIFPCIALNFGGRVWALPHRDTKNLPYGVCAITALGKFDPTTGGHIVLHELKLIIEFPPGSTILIPSATITHSNIPIRDFESRLSFTQFCAGDIFRFIDCGFRTQRQLQQDDPKAFEKYMESKAGRWEKGLSMFSKVGDVFNDYKRCVKGKK